jgi:hypothetical protein
MDKEKSRKISSVLGLSGGVLLLYGAILPIIMAFKHASKVSDIWQMRGLNILILLFLAVMIFGIIIGALFGATIVIVDATYNAIFFGSVITGNGFSISSYMVNTIASGINIGMIIGGIFGAFFGMFFGIIHSAIGGKGAVGGAIAGSLITGEVFQSLSGVISGLLAGAIAGEVWSKGRMRSMVTGASVGAGVGAFLSAAGGFAVYPPYISLIFILPAFLIIGYRAGMIFVMENRKS